MSRLEDVKAVLCDPEGNVCIKGSDEDRQIIQTFLDSAGKETCPEAHYYEMAKIMMEFIQELRWHSGARSFINQNCEPLDELFDKMYKEIETRSPDLFLEP